MTGFLKIRERTGDGQRCAYCREDLDDKAVPCPDCATALHAECWWELSSCPTIGCQRDADFVERPRRYRDPKTVEARREKPFRIFRAPHWRREEAATERGSGPWLLCAVLALFSLVPIGINLGARSLALLGFAAGMVALLVLVVVSTRGR